MIDIADLYANQGVSEDVCPIHGCKKIQYTGFKQPEAHEPVCVQCIEEANERKLQRMQRDMFNQRFIRGSLLDDKGAINCTFDSFKPTTPREQQLMAQAEAIAKAFAQKRDAEHTVFLTGNPGSGKTHLGMSILNYVRSNSNQRVLAVSVNELIVRVKKSWNDPEEHWTESESILQMSAGKTDLLLLDDLGTESSMQSNNSRQSADFVQKILFSVLNRQKRLIVTSNFSIDQLKDIYNPKIVSRLLANSKGTRLDFGGVSDKRMEC